MAPFKFIPGPVRSYVAELSHAMVRGWNDFWFTPVDPATLGAVRIAVGLVLLYVHLAGASAATCSV